MLTIVQHQKLQALQLPIDIAYGVSLTDSYSDCKSYAAKLEHRLKWAYEAAQKLLTRKLQDTKSIMTKIFVVLFLGRVI